MPFLIPQITVKHTNAQEENSLLITKKIFICQNTDLLNYKTKASFQTHALETRNDPAPDGQLLKVQIPDVSSSRQRGPYRFEEFLASESQDSNLSAYTSSL